MTNAVMTPHETFIAIILAIIGSGGFWSMMQLIATKHSEKRSATARLLLGLSHEQILQQCALYEERGYITPDEYSELEKYLYEPYRKLGGNGAVEREMQRVKALPSEEPKDTKKRSSQQVKATG